MWLDRAIDGREVTVLYQSNSYSGVNRVEEGRMELHGYLANSNPNPQPKRRKGVGGPDEGNIIVVFIIRARLGVLSGKLEHNSLES